MEKSKKLAFSLAELMITLLILSIVLSAVMPAVTKRNTASESIWRWSDDNSASTYFGTGNHQTVLIGLAKKPATDGVAIEDYSFPHTAGTDYMSLTSDGDRLMLETVLIGPHPVSNSHITFFTDNAAGTDPHYTGRLALDATNIALGKYTLARIQALPADATNPNSKNNIAIGQSAMHDLTTGHNNLAIGNEALFAVATNFGNIAIGNGTLKANHYGRRNTALGFQSLTKVTGSAATNDSSVYDGNNNTALGYQTLFNVVNGYENNAVGHQAGYGIYNGYMNTAIGNYAMRTYSEAEMNAGTVHADYNGYANTALGYQALFAGSAANFNTALGMGSGRNTSSGSDNTFAGTLSGYSNTEGVNNTFIGSNSGYTSSTGSNNTMLGYKSGYNSTEGINNIFIGSETGLANTSGSNNTYMGTNAGKQHTGSSNVFVGAGAGYGGTNPAGGQNVYVGNNSGYANTSGEHNAFLGYNSGTATSTGSQNTFIGSAAGLGNTSGANNVYIGYRAGADNTTANDSLIIANGHSELITGTFNSTPANTILNLKAASVKVGTDTSSPTFSVINSNINLNGLLYGNPNNSTISVKNKIDMGQQNIENAGTVKAGAVEAVGNVKATTMTVGDDITTSSLHATTVYANTIYGTVAGVSDKRLKNITGDAEKGLSAVDAFRIVKFNYKNDEKKTEHVGVIAQELQEVMPNAVVTREDGFLAITLSDITFTIAKALQELHEAVIGIAKDLKALTVKVTTNSEKIEALEKENKALKQQINDLDARLKKLEAAK